RRRLIKRARQRDRFSANTCAPLRSGCCVSGVANPTLQDSADRRPQDPDNDRPQGIVKAVEPERRVVVSNRLALAPSVAAGGGLQTLQCTRKSRKRGSNFARTSL